MAMTRQYGNPGARGKGTITFSPASLEINSSLLPDFGDFSLKVIVNIKDSNGYVVPNDNVSFTLDKSPQWIMLSPKEIKETTNQHGNTTLIINGTLEKEHQNTDFLAIPFTIHSEHLQISAIGTLDVIR